MDTLEWIVLCIGVLWGPSLLLGAYLISPRRLR